MGCHPPIITHRRSYMTLMEVLIVLVILAVVIGVVAINLTSMARQERFRAGTSFLVDRLQLAQDIMIIFGVDVKAVLEQQPKGVVFRLDYDISQVPQKLLHRVTTPMMIGGIQEFTFTNAQGVSQKDRVELLFMSRGTKMSQGNLALSAGPGDELTRYIPLTGTPLTIRSSSKPIPAPSIVNLSLQLYPLEVIEREQKPNGQ